MNLDDIANLLRPLVVNVLRPLVVNNGTRLLQRAIADPSYRAGICDGLLAALLVGSVARWLLFNLGIVRGYFAPTPLPATRPGPSPADRGRGCAYAAVRLTLVVLLLIVALAIIVPE